MKEQVELANEKLKIYYQAKGISSELLIERNFKSKFEDMHTNLNEQISQLHKEIDRYTNLKYQNILKKLTDVQQYLTKQTYSISPIKTLDHNPPSLHLYIHLYLALDHYIGRNSIVFQAINNNSNPLFSSLASYRYAKTQDCHFAFDLYNTLKQYHTKDAPHIKIIKSVYKNRQLSKFDMKSTDLLALPFSNIHITNGSYCMEYESLLHFKQQVKCLLDNELAQLPPYSYHNKHFHMKYLKSTSKAKQDGYSLIYPKVSLQYYKRKL